MLPQAVVLRFPRVERPVAHRHEWHVFPGPDLVTGAVQWKTWISQSSKECVEDSPCITLRFQIVQASLLLPDIYRDR